MHKLLGRQVKRLLGVSEEQLPPVIAELQQLAATGALSAEASGLLSGLNTFLSRVDQAYQQCDRDLDLKSRTLELNSADLTLANQRLRNDLESRTRAIDSLRETANGLMASDGNRKTLTTGDDLEALSALMRDLFQQREQSQKELYEALADLAYQKFALDQHAIVSITDIDGKIIYANDKLCQISGYSREELLDQNHRLINSGIHDTAFFAHMWSTIKRGEVWHGEICNRAKLGHLYWVFATIVPLRDDEGRPSKFIAIRTDISERKRMESTVKEAAARLRHITNTVPGVIFQWHIRPGASSYDVKYTFVSDRLQQIRGLTPQALTDDPNLAVEQILPEDRVRVLEKTLTAARQREVCRAEYRIRLPDQSIRWIRMEINPESDLASDGSTVFTGIWQDVTELKEADARLREVTENVPIAVFQYDVDASGIFKISFISRAIQNMSGADTEDVVEQDELLKRIHPDDKATVMQTWAHSAKEAQPWKMDFRLVHKTTQATVWVHGEAHPQHFPNRRMTWNGFITDITAAKNISVELEKAKEDAEAASRSKSDFLANMSHEIRTPMNGVLGTTELLYDTPLSTEQREYLDIVKHSADALLRVINDILDFSKIEAGKLDIEEIAFNLEQTVADTLKTVAQAAHHKGLELVCDIAPHVPSTVIGDPGRLRQILVNLIGNAIKFTAKGEVILRINTAPDTNQSFMLHLTVADTGIGIAENKLGTIFEAFSQEDSSTTRTYGGTGLGLTICTRLAQAMGGHIWVESQVGKGSIFHVTMRMGRCAEVQTNAPLRNAGFSHIRALVVDDNQINRMLLIRTLETFGMQTWAFESGAQAFRWLEEAGHASQACDLMILDAQMPEMSGFDIAKRMQSHAAWSKIPLVMLSSSGLNGDAQRSRDVGIAAYTSKPVMRDQLLKIIGRVLGDATEPQISRPATPLVKATQAGLNILLVEDNAVNQKLAVLLLERWGHCVTVAENGQIAVDTMAKQGFDLVLMDMLMPVMDGLEATRRIRLSETGHRTPIFAMTANAMEVDRQRCLAAGMDDYLSKPIRKQEFQMKLDTVVRNTPTHPAPPPMQATEDSSQ